MTRQPHDLGNFLVDDGVVKTSVHNFQPQELYEFGLFLRLCCRRESQQNRVNVQLWGHLRECQEMGQPGAALPIPNSASSLFPTQEISTLRAKIFPVGP